MSMAANDNYLVYVPDRTSPFTFPKSMTAEEVRQSLVATGYTQVENADLTLENGGNTIRFRRPQGGTKGL